jgi:hypothetical protein
MRKIRRLRRKRSNAPKGGKTLYHPGLRDWGP